MAEVKLTAVIDAKDNASKTFASFKGKLGEVGSQVGGVLKTMATGAAIVGGAMAVFAKQSVDAFIAAEQANARLDAQLVNYLKRSPGLVKAGQDQKSVITALNQELSEQASALQRLTQFDDDAIKSSQALLFTFALTKDQVKALTPAVLDAAEALRKTSGGTIDLEQASIAIGKAMTTGLGPLKRWGVTVTEAQEEAFKLANQQDRVKLLTEVLNANFEGTAAAAANTYSGRITQLKNAVGDLQEGIGGAILEALDPFIKKMSVWASDPATVKKIQDITNTMIQLAQIAIPAVIKGFEIAIKIFKGVSDVLANILYYTGKVSSGLKSVSDKIGIGWLSKAAGSVAGFLGFAEGGVVPGPVGAPVPAVVHGGEMIIPPGKTAGNVFNFNFAGAYIGDKNQFISEIKRSINRESELKSYAGL